MVIILIVQKFSHSSPPCCILSILPIFSTIVYNSKNIPLSTQAEVSWLALVLLVWFLSALDSDTAWNSETTELHNTVEELADIVASNFLLRMDVCEKITSYECAERHFKVLSLFQLYVRTFIHNLTNETLSPNPLPYIVFPGTR